MLIRFLRKTAKSILVAVNSLLALCMLAGSFGGWLNPIHYWFTGYFTLGLFYIALALIIFFFFWLMTRPWISLISLLTLIICWNPLTEVLPARLSSHFNINKENGNMRVMSWNVEHFDILEHKSHPERKQEMLSLINSYRPDIACFQEMVASDSFPDAINYLPAFVKALGMDELHYSFNPKLDFDKKHHFGLIIFSRHPIINRQTISYRPNDYNSIFQYADIVAGKDTFRVFNIHLQSLRFSGENKRYIAAPEMNDEADIKQSKNLLDKFRTGFLKRYRQSDRIREEIRQSPYPVIICGDFNDVPNSYAYNHIGYGLQNAFAEKGIGTGRTYSGISPTLRIDNIFCDNRFTVEQYIRVRKKLSDHFPILADLQYRPQ